MFLDAISRFSFRKWFSFFILWNLKFFSRIQLLLRIVEFLHPIFSKSWSNIFDTFLFNYFHLTCLRVFCSKEFSIRALYSYLTLYNYLLFLDYLLVLLLPDRLVKIICPIVRRVCWRIISTSEEHLLCGFYNNLYKQYKARAFEVIVEATWCLKWMATCSNVRLIEHH